MRNAWWIVVVMGSVGFACEADVGPEPAVAPFLATPPGGSAWYTPPPCPSSGYSFSCGRLERGLTGTLARACTDERWIGYRLSGPSSCATPGVSPKGTWKVNKLFPAPSSPNVPVPAELDRFCVYEWTPNTPGYPADINVLPDSASVRLERDCHAVTSLYTPQPATTEALIDVADAAVGRPDYSGRVLGPNGVVALAVVDTSPRDVTSNFPADGGDGHGFTVGAVARDHSCRYRGDTPLSCAADILSFQGLPENGGATGYPSDVALAMFDAMDHWYTRRPNDPLIINLSLGWDAIYSGLHGPGIRVTGLAVWLMTQWAKCNGVLVIAASGNQSQIGSASGPMFPAGWEEDTSICQTPSFPYSPPIFAIGGVLADDEPLRLTPPGSLPRVLAPAFFGAREVALPNKRTVPTDVRTGSSIAAATVSGLAAHVWGHDLGLTAAEVMTVIYEAGVIVSPSADVVGNGLPDQIRIDACSAVRDVCLGGACPGACTVRPHQVPVPIPTPTILDTEYPGLRLGPWTPGITTSLAIDVPLVRPVLTEPAAGPLPGIGACPVCLITNQTLFGKLEIEKGTEILDVILRPDECGAFCDPDLDGVRLDGIDPKVEFKIDLVPVVGNAPMKSAILEVYVADGDGTMVTASEIIVD